MSRRISLAAAVGITVAAGCVIIGLSVDAAGQSFYGGIRGTVRDVDGVTPAVQMTLVNDDTNIARSLTTNTVGEYAFTDIVPGPYTLRAALTGYKTFERRGLIVATQVVEICWRRRMRDPLSPICCVR